MESVSCSDGKRLDGATLVPWKCGKLLVWDATCVDTLLYGMQHVWTPYCMECNMCGHLIVWDATCVDTLLYGMQHVWTPMHLLLAELHHRRLGTVADQAERRKYSNMDPNMYLFAPVVIETSGVFGQQTLSFLKDHVCCVRKVSGEVLSFSYLIQRLTVAVQRGNADSVLGTFASDDLPCF